MYLGVKMNTDTLPSQARAVGVRSMAIVQDAPAPLTGPTPTPALTSASPSTYSTQPVATSGGSESPGADVIVSDVFATTAAPPSYVSLPGGGMVAIASPFAYNLPPPTPALIMTPVGSIDRTAPFVRGRKRAKRFGLSGHGLGEAEMADVSSPLFHAAQDINAPQGTAQYAAVQAANAQAAQIAATAAAAAQAAVGPTPVYGTGVVTSSPAVTPTPTKSTYTATVAPTNADTGAVLPSTGGASQSQIDAINAQVQQANAMLAAANAAAAAARTTAELNAALTAAAAARGQQQQVAQNAAAVGVDASGALVNDVGGVAGGGTLIPQGTGGYGVASLATSGTIAGIPTAYALGGAALIALLLLRR